MNTIRDTGYRHELARLTPGLRRFARALVRNHHVDLADDLVQTTLTQALGGDHGLRGTRLQLWLVSTLVELHRDFVRTLNAEQRLNLAGSDASAPGGSPPLKASRRDPALLGNVPLEYREALLLVVLEGMTYAQVADCLGLSATVVATRVARARDYLARAQEDWSSHKPADAMTNRVLPSRASHLRVVK